LAKFDFLKMVLIFVFFLFSINSVLSAPTSDQKGSELLQAYNHFLVSPTFDCRLNFINVGHRFLQDQFLTSVELLSQKNFAFRCAFFTASSRKHTPINRFEEISYKDLFNDILRVIRLKLSRVFQTKDDKQEYFEAIRKLIKMAQEIPGSHSKRELIALEFAYRNMFYNSTLDSLDYVSLFRTFQNTMSLLSDSVHCDSQTLFNECTQLSVYLAAISSQYLVGIFEDANDRSVIHSIRPFLVFLIMRIGLTPFEISTIFQDDQARCVSELTWLLSGDVSAKILLYLNQLKENALKGRFGFRIGPVIYKGKPLCFNILAQLSISQITNIIKSYNFKPKKFWILKAIIELKRFLNGRDPKN
jgi:hypothetical protein